MEEKALLQTGRWKRKQPNYFILSRVFVCENLIPLYFEVAFYLNAVGRWSLNHTGHDIAARCKKVSKTKRISSFFCMHQGHLTKNNNNYNNNERHKENFHPTKWHNTKSMRLFIACNDVTFIYFIVFFCSARRLVFAFFRNIVYFGVVRCLQRKTSMCFELIVSLSSFKGFFFFFWNVR